MLCNAAVTSDPKEQLSFFQFQCIHVKPAKLSHLEQQIDIFMELRAQPPLSSRILMMLTWTAL